MYSAQNLKNACAALFLTTKTKISTLPQNAGTSSKTPLTLGLEVLLFHLIDVKNLACVHVCVCVCVALNKFVTDITSQRHTLLYIVWDLAFTA